MFQLSQQNDSSDWNAPPSYNQNFKKLNSNQDDPRKIVICYKCKEVGHNKNNCPNLKNPQDYAPLCDNYTTIEHPIDECPWTS